MSDLIIFLSLKTFLKLVSIKMDSIEIILKKDSNGQDIDLNNMSLEASKSLREILDALIEIVQYETELDLTIGIEKGSIAQKINGTPTDLTIIFNNIEKVAENRKDRDNFYVKNLNIIYNNLAEKDFDVLYKKNNTEKSIKPLFQKKFKGTRDKVKKQNYFSLYFIEGELVLNGGVNPNFHIKRNDGKPVTVNCTIQEAKKINTLLYENIHLSAWGKEKKDKIEFTFCDLYIGTSTKYFFEFKDFYEELINKNGAEPFHFISEKLEYFYNNKEFDIAKKFIRLFLNESSLPIYLRTILVISKSFKNDDSLKDILKDVEELLTKKIGKVY